MSEFLTVLAQVVGWIYFTAWSISFYGQVYENYTRKSCKGFNLDFAVYNALGFTCYAIYSQVGYMNTDSAAGKVEIQDLIFAYHALALTFVQLSQTFCYDKGGQKVTWICISNCCLLILLLFVIAMIADVTDTYSTLHFGLIAFLGYVKVYISFIKYMPQAYYNYARKSTVGWSIFNILMDFTGGSFSFLQIFIVSGNSGNWDIFSGGSLNVAKFALSVISVFFDILFMFQHYVFYAGARKRDNMVRQQDDQDTGIFKNKMSNPSLEGEEENRERLLA